ncbi:3-isopropylmalate dehydratase [Sporosarcina sp. FSL W7-1283]|uniref:3-isopropylmalate dehydratase n=1 Tax=Sporosarcina sp. FSL W7-1283 TaxID=2921560 RepID=UPI0030FC33A6
MMENLDGRVCWVFDEPNFDIDLIVGVTNMKIQDIEKLKEVCMSNYDKDFTNQVQEGDVIIGGENFGYGHPHYPSCRALRALGVKGIIAESFSPGFYRGESTNGFPLIECKGIAKVADRWDHIIYDWDTEELTLVNKGITLKSEKVPEKTKDLIKYGDIISYLQNRRLTS